MSSLITEENFPEKCLAVDVPATTEHRRGTPSFPEIIITSMFSFTLPATLFGTLAYTVTAVVPTYFKCISPRRNAQEFNHQTPLISSRTFLFNINTIPLKDLFNVSLQTCVECQRVFRLTLHLREIQLLPLHLHRIHVTLDQR